MARNQQPSWVSDLQYPAKGIGDLNDLSFKTLIGEASKWTLALKAGWYYLDQEDYFYRVETTKTYTSLASGAQTLTGTGGYNLGWGPVLISDGTDQYSPVGSNLSLANALSWTASGSDGLYYATIPTTQTLVGVRDLTNIPMAAVKSISHLTNTKLYYFNPTTRRLYVLSSGSPANTYFADLLIPQHTILQRELVWVTDGVVRLKNYPAINTTIYRGTTSSVVGTVTGAWEPDLGEEGDWLVATYYLDKSYALISNTQAAVYSTAVNNVTVRNEGSSPASDRIVYPTNDTDNKIDFNPINPDSYGPGYLIVTDETLTAPTMKSIVIKADKTSFCSDWSEQVNVRIQALDINDLPIPQKEITVVHNATQLNTFDTSMTSKQGEILMRLSHSATITVSASGDGVSGTLTITAQDEDDILDADFISDGRVSLVVKADKDSKDNYVSYCNAHQLDGIPKAVTIYVRAKKGTSFFYQDQDYKKTLELTTAITPLSPTATSTYFGVLPAKGDFINATITNGQSKIIEVVDA